jgi:hypothetical protein
MTFIVLTLRIVGLNVTLTRTSFSVVLSVIMSGVLMLSAIMLIIKTLSQIAQYQYRV